MNLVTGALLLLGFGFLIANAKLAWDYVRFLKRRRSALLTWRIPKPPQYTFALGLGVALKCADGAGRAAEVVMASVISGLLKLSDRERDVIERARRPVLKNWNGVEVGGLKASADLDAAMAQLAAAPR